ncbi:tRNA-specific adenosine deaminase subunit Tad3p [Diutina catenulata]
MGKQTGRPEANYETGIVYNLLQQVRWEEANTATRSPSVESIWIVEVKPQQSPLLLSLVKNLKEPRELGHLKRFCKGSEGRLRAVVCSEDLFETRDSLCAFINQEVPELDFSSPVLIEVPDIAPFTREICDEWSATYWPMVWKGNPNHQFLSGVRFDIEHEQALVKRLIAQHDGSGSTTFMVDPNTREVVAKATTDKTRGPVGHSIMIAIDYVASEEKRKRRGGSTDKGYLCHNLHVYTTHEPCVMCCMALVHSRIGRVIYLKSVVSGAFESNFQLGDRDGLNWKFEIWRWLGEQADDLTAEAIDY